MEDENQCNHIALSSTDDDGDEDISDNGNNADNEDNSIGSQEGRRTIRQDDDDEYSSDNRMFRSLLLYGNSHYGNYGKTNTVIGSGIKLNAKEQQRNIILRLFKREYSGTSFVTHRISQPFIETVPRRLSFCLRDVIPTTGLSGHIFMGLSLCGQFLISYKICCNDAMTMPIFRLNATYKYRLYFWIYRPHKKIRLFHHCCLFDDHSVDNVKDVSMVQWRSTNPRILIIHGAGMEHTEDSYITYVKVPKLGCIDCKKLRDTNNEGACNPPNLCIKCSLTVHIKYTMSETNDKFEPYIQMICPEHILLLSNGFLHMVHIRLNDPSISAGIMHTTTQQQHQSQAQQQSQTSSENISGTSQMIYSSLFNKHYDCYYSEDVTSNGGSVYNNIEPIYIPVKRNHQNVENEPPLTDLLHNSSVHCDNANNILTRIVEDFSDIESSSISQHSGCETTTNIAKIVSGNCSYTNINSTNTHTELCRPPVKRPPNDDLIKYCHNNNDHTSHNEDSADNCNNGDNNITKLNSVSVQGFKSKSNTCHNNNDNVNNGYTFYNTNATTSSSTSVRSSSSTTALPKSSIRQKYRIVTKPFRRRGMYAYFSNATAAKENDSRYGDIGASSINNNNTNNNNSDITTTAATISGSSSCNNNSYNNNNDKASAYEFHEDNEKCEKISILRKKRLADRKYEFSDDNSENIKPFTIKRSATTFLSPINSGGSGATSSHLITGTDGLVNTGLINVAGNTTISHHQSPRSSFSYNFHNNNNNNNSPFSSPSTSPRSYVPTNNFTSRYRATTSSTTTPTAPSTQSSSNSFGGCLPLNFRSPQPSTSSSSCNTNYNNVNVSMNTNINGTDNCSSSSSSPVSIRSPNCHLIGFASSPRYDNSSGGSGGGLEWRTLEWRTTEVPIQGAAMSEKPLCTKKFQRCFVEEDDAASVITSEGDDCISPGYHTLLPLEVHGSCYSEMQMISKASYQRLHCTSVLVDQHSFDLEMFTYYVISTLCQKYDESFDFIIDWVYEIINVCPLSCTVFCILIVHFRCRHKIGSPNSVIKMMRKMPTAKKASSRKFECRVLFCWNMVSGEWKVLDFGELYDPYVSADIVPFNVDEYRYGHKNYNFYLAWRAKYLANQVLECQKKILPDYTSNLRVLDSNVARSKDSIADLDNLVEFRLRKNYRT